MKPNPLVLVLRNLFLIITLVAFLAGSGCNSSNEADEIKIDLSDQDPEMVLPPGYPATLEGSTLVIKGYDSAPVVHSYPAYAGVENEGELGIGSSAGYDPDDSFIIPVNANLGNKNLKSYKFLIIISDPDALKIKQLSGNNQNLHKNYPDQYDPADGFSAVPQVSDGATEGYTYVSATGTNTATGRINLAEIGFIITEKLPDSGVRLNFEVVELKDDSENDICAQFDGGCSPRDGLVINNFTIQK